MSQVLQQYLGRLHVGSDRDSFSVGATALTIPAGWYYLCGYTGEATAQLCEAMQALIRGIGATQDASTVVYDAATGRVTITLKTAATLTWTDSALGVLLGNPATASGTLHAGTAQPRFVWRPSRALASYPTDGPTWWAEESTTLGVRAPKGTTYSVAGELLYSGAFAYRNLPSSDVIVSSGCGYVPLQQFWRDVIHEGQPFRCYYDRTSAASANVFTARVSGGEDGIGSFLKIAQRAKPPYNGYWNVGLQLEKWVSM